MRKLATTAAVLTTIVAVCFAMLQVGGRVLCWQMPRLEGPINKVLASRGIAVRGIEGRWQGLNLGFFAAHVRTPAGEAFDIDFELDLLESLARNRVVARRLTVADGHLALEKTADGWRLAQSEGPRAGDAVALLWHSDEVWLRGRLALRDGGRSAALQVEAMLLNEDDGHRFHVTVQGEPNCADCALTVDGDIREGGAGAVRAVATRFALGRELDAMLGLGASSPRGPRRQGTGAADHAVFALRGDWRRGHDGDAAAVLTASADIPSPLGGTPVRLATTLTAWSVANGYRGRVEQVALASGGSTAALADGAFRLATDGDDGPFVDLWLPTLDLGALAAPVTAFVGDERETGVWLRRLAPGGRIHDLVLRIGGGAGADGLAFSGRGTNGSLAGYKGMPKVANANFTFGGHGAALRVYLAGRNLTMAFPNFFPSKAPFDRAGGVLTLAFTPGYIGLRGTEFWGEQNGARGAGGFAWARPVDMYEARVTADFAVDRADLALARGYLPLTLEPGLRQWLQDSVRAGNFVDGRLVYHGHVRQWRPGATGKRERAPRRTELAVRIVDGTLDYHPDWPPVSAFNGRLVVGHDHTSVTGRGRAFDTALADLDVYTPRAGAHTRVRFAATAPADRVLRFARTTPTRDALPFLSDAWRARGQVDFRADLTVPLQGQALRPGDIRLDLTLDDVDLDLADLGLRFERVRNRVSFASPHSLTTPDDTALDGVLFGAPAHVAFRADDNAVRVAVSGAAATTDALRLLHAGANDLVAGAADFDATLSLFPNTTRAPELQIDSTLEGVAVALPTPLGKAAEASLPARVVMQFLDSHIAVSMRYGAADGWLQVADGAVYAGAIGIGAPMPMVDAERGRVVLGGELDMLDTHTVAALMAAPAAEGAGLAWELRDFRVGTLALESARLHDVVLNGHADDAEQRFVIAGRELAGTVAKRGDAPWQVRLDALRLPVPPDEAPALSTDVIDRLVRADVTIGDLRIGETHYGSWQFGLRPEIDGVVVLGIEGQGVRGLDILATAPAFWAKAGETSFTGVVRTPALREALTAWDFAPSIESEWFEAAGELRWPGSPFDFALAHISGNATLRLDTGRFLTVEPGGARIMSLINFSEILRRMKLDFSDVFGRGSDFDKVRAALAVNDGLAHFVRPAEITGSGASFRIGGTVNLDTGALDNEMIATVSLLHRNLPWYAAFLAFSNPASAAGVLLGSQVLFKDEIKQFSSGKYTIGGTYDDPDVRFVGIWRDDIAAPAIPETDAKPKAPAMARVDDTPAQGN